MSHRLRSRYGHATRNLSSSYGRVYEDDTGTVKQFVHAPLIDPGDEALGPGWYWRSWVQERNGLGWVGPFTSRARAEMDMHNMAGRL